MTKLTLFLPKSTVLTRNNLMSTQAVTHQITFTQDYTSHQSTALVRNNPYHGKYYFY